MNLPLVSISCITYNQAAFICSCFDGFLSQITNFEFEILVHDDASTDGTKQIIEDYTAKYPNLFFPIYQSENQYSKGLRGIMVRFNFPRARGKYIALCEGDDYWIDPYKLQKQVDFLESNPDYGLVHTSCQHTVKKRQKIHQNPELVSSGSVFKNLLSHDFYISTLTVCVRKDLILEWHKILENEMIKREWKMGDYPLWLEGSLHTKFGFIPDITAQYRILDESLTHSKDINKKFEFFESVFNIKNYFIERENVDPYTQKKINLHYNKMLLYFAFYLRNREYGTAAYSFLKRNAKIQVKDFLFYLGSRNYLLWFLLSKLLKVKRVLMN